MLDGLAYGLYAAFVWGLTDICAALASRRMGGLATVAGVQAASLIGLYLFAIITQGGLSLDPAVAPGAVGIGIVSAVAYIAFFTALGLGPITVVSPVASAYGGLTVVLAVILLGERLTSSQAVGAALGTLGILMVGLRVDGHWRTARFVGPGVPLAIVALVGWGFVTIGLSVLVREAGVLPVILVTRTANVVTVWLLVAGRRLLRRGALPIPGRVQARILGLAVLGGLLDVSGYIVYATGLQKSLVWLVGLSSSFGPAVAILIAVVLLGERLRPVQWLGLGALATGIVLVGLP